MRKAIEKLVTLSLCCSLFFTQNIAADTHYDVPINNTIKTYMGYKSITKKNSPQWALQTEAVNDANGLRVRNGRYLVAVGSGYGAPVGTDIDVTLDTGVVLPCTVGDMKGDQHTDPTNRWALSNNNVLEFIVDQGSLNSVAARMGDIGALPGFEGQVRGINVLGVTNPVVEVPEPIPTPYIAMAVTPTPTPEPTVTPEPTPVPEPVEEKVTPELTLKVGDPDNEKVVPEITLTVGDTEDHSDLTFEESVDKMINEAKNYEEKATYGVPGGIAAKVQGALDEINNTNTIPEHKEQDDAETDDDDFEIYCTTSVPTTVISD